LTRNLSHILFVFDLVLWQLVEELAGDHVENQ
jgi:hypothetical protein